MVTLILLVYIRDTYVPWHSCYCVGEGRCSSGLLGQERSALLLNRLLSLTHGEPTAPAIESLLLYNAKKNLF